MENYSEVFLNRKNFGIFFIILINNALPYAIFVSPFQGSIKVQKPTFLVQETPKALGIGAASFWSAAEKDIAESPTRSGTPKKNEIWKWKVGYQQLVVSFQRLVEN